MNEYIYKETGISRKRLRASRALILQLFNDPSASLHGFPAAKSRWLSHDNEMNLFLKVDARIVFNKRFKRSNAAATDNEKAAAIIMELGALAHE